jgi:hypothetical protein
MDTNAHDKATRSANQVLKAASSFAHALIIPVVYQPGPPLCGRSAEIRRSGYWFGSTRSRPGSGFGMDVFVAGFLGHVCDGPCVEAKQVHNAQRDVGSD